MRTSGAPADGPLTYIPIFVAAALLLALFGGPNTVLRSLDTALREGVGAIIDTAKEVANRFQL